MKDNDKKSAVLVCGREVNRVRRSIASGDSLDNPIVLARVEVDLDCFHRPIVSLDFSTFIQVIDGIRPEAETEGVLLNIQLKRICNDRKEVLKDYQFVRAVFIEDGSYNTRDSFKFIFCDDFNCRSECCKYTVELVSFQLLGIEMGILDELIIEDSSIRAIIKELC